MVIVFFLILSQLFFLISTAPLPLSESSAQEYNFFFERKFHPVNSQAAQNINDKLMATINNSEPDAGLQIPSNWFQGELTQFGTFITRDKYLRVDKIDGSLSLVPKGDSAATDMASDHSTFSIKKGYLMHNGVQDFTMCYSESINELDYYTLHVTQERGATCVAKVDGINVKVYNEHGTLASDFEAPEFMYNTGKLMFL